jgi:hypothetical protein
MMRHPVRTLLYELFIEPFLQLLERAFGQKPAAGSPENEEKTGGIGKDLHWPGPTHGMRKSRESGSRGSPWTAQSDNGLDPQAPEGDAQMKMLLKLVISLALVLLSTPIISGQDLSKYRDFSLGTSLAAISKQVGEGSQQANLIHQSPAVIQELTYWPLDPSYSSGQTEPVSQILFSFDNGVLYRIVVTYNNSAIEGLTEQDMVRAISLRYGTGTRVSPEIDFQSNDVYASPEKVIARWEDSENSVNLLRSSMNSFQLAVFSKRLNAEAEASIAESVKLEKEQAPQKEIDRQKKVVDDLEAARLKNQKAFRP